MPDDYIMTVESDSDSELPNIKTKKVDDEDGFQLDPDLELDALGDAMDFSWDELAKPGRDNGHVKQVISVDDIIARRTIGLKGGAVELSDESESHSSADDDEDDEEDEVLSQPDDQSDSEDSVDEDAQRSTSSKLASDTKDDTAEQLRQQSFFAKHDTASSKVHTTFLSMNLSRPLLKSLAAMSFETPTPIQSTAIPFGLLGKDIVGAAVTGSGKTAAFLIPVLERLLHRDKSRHAAATRCAVLVPTRELAVQCFEVGKKLAAHMDVQFCLLVGGLSLKAQETALRSQPDIVIATPGRLIDHLRNSPNFALDALDVLILDEADRMLEDGFHDELTEIVKSCSSSRQTMLFSATMTDSVDDLVKMSLSNPVRLFVDPKHSTAKGLLQEFVRVRQGKESERSAMLYALCRNSFRHRVIVFLRSKKLAHQLRIMFGLLGLKCGELHGNLTQEQRLAALSSFRAGTVDFLMATDLASRGLDIKGIETVINYDMPTQLAQYLHRVGRTARAGKRGRSVTFVGEGDRKILKLAIKHGGGADKIRHRIIPTELLVECSHILESIKTDISGVMEEEGEEKALRRAEMEIQKGQNMIEHEDEIFSRPARTWFQSSKEKEAAQRSSKEQYQDGFSPKTQISGNPAVAPEAHSKHKATPLKRDKLDGLSRKAKRRKISQEDDGDDEKVSKGSMNASIRQAKKSARPAKIGVPDLGNGKKTSQTKKRKAAGMTKNKKMGGFGRDMNERVQSEGARSKRTDSKPSLSGGKRRSK